MTCGPASEGALFERRGREYVPTSLTTGPWRPDAMHGGPPSALIGTAIAAATDAGEHVAGIQIDLERPVPIEPLTVTVVRLPRSRRVAQLAVEIHARTGRVVTAKVLLLRGEPLPAVAGDKTTPAPPAELASMAWSERPHRASAAYHIDAVEHRVVRGGYAMSGPSTAWLRPTVAVVVGEEASGLAQLLAVADFGSALSQGPELGPGVGLINVDVNVSLTRSPVGPWFCLEARGLVSHEGIGLAVARVHDITGPLGAVTQSQIAHRYQWGG